MSKVFVVSSSMRKNGNSEILCDAFIKGSKESNNEVKKLSLKDIDLKFCIGCLNCQRKGVCVLKDDVEKYLEDIQNSDILVFATPIYYYAMCGQLKTFLDRLNPLFPKYNKFKKVYLLATSSDGDRAAMDGAIKEVEGWISCFNGVKLSNVIYGVSSTNVGDVKNTNAVEDAYNLGKSIK